MMAAALLKAPRQGLEMVRLPVPEPGPGEVLLKVIACGVCHTDLHVMLGEVAFPTPAVLGHEVSGEVVACGEGVDVVKPGDSVVSAFIMPCGTCEACARGRDDLCHKFFSMNRLNGVLYDGSSRLRRESGEPVAMYSMAGLAEYAVVPATDVFPIPEGVDRETAAILGCAAFTAYGAVSNVGEVRPGYSVAVVAAGGVGLSLIRMARIFGATRIIAVDVDDTKLGAARESGATDTVNSSDRDPVAAVRELTGGVGVDVAFEALGRPATFEQAFAMVRDGGTMVPVGIADGPATAAIGITHLVRRGIRIAGSFGARTRSDMPVLLELVASGRLSLEGMITRKVGLAEADQVYRDLAAGKVTGRALVLP